MKRFLMVGLFLARLGYAAPVEAMYFKDGNENRTNSFRMTVKVNDANILSHANNLHADVEVKQLGGSFSRILPKVKVTNFGPGWPLVVRTVDNLPKTTVFLARLRLFIPIGSTSGTYQFVGQSNWYYTTTSDDLEKSEVRTNMVMRGFYELDQSDRGFVGENGTVKVDGTRYGASKGEKWCSEFFAWLAKEDMKNIAGKSTVSQLKSYFSLYGALYSSAANIVKWGRRADYVAMDSDNDGDTNHSGMFLAYEVSGGNSYVWTLEGNKGNKVKVVRRALSLIKNLGHITYSMLD